jgi:hypothetical protein
MDQDVALEKQTSFSPFLICQNFTDELIEGYAHSMG